MDIALFRSSFPEFTDITRYPDSQVTFWSGIAEVQLPQCVWTVMWTRAVMLYTAHEITLAGQNAATGSIGGTPGQSSGPTSSKSVGGASISYDTNQGAEKDAGWWNLTTYGKQLYRLMMMYGAGGIQL